MKISRGGGSDRADLIGPLWPLVVYVCSVLAPFCVVSQVVVRHR